MYDKLVPLLGEFLIVGTTVGVENTFFLSKLVDITPDTYELELFSTEGHSKGSLVGPLMAITSIQHGNRELKELALNVSMNKTCEREALTV